MYENLISRARAAASRATNGAFLRELADALEQCERFERMGVVEKCQVTRYQQCDECPKIDCCDNTSPAKKKIDEVSAISEGYQRTARDLGQAVDNVRRALGLESTHWIVIHDQVADVVKERDALREERDQAWSKLKRLADVGVGEVESLVAERDRLRDRLQIDPGGSDKIDELEQALQFVRCERDRFQNELAAAELAGDALEEDRDQIRDERDAVQKDLDRIMDAFGIPDVGDILRERKLILAERERLEAEAGRVREEMDSLRDETAAVKLTLQSITAERDNLREKTENLEEQVDAWKRKYQDKIFSNE